MTEQQLEDAMFEYCRHPHRSDAYFQISRTYRKDYDLWLARNKNAKKTPNELYTDLWVQLLRWKRPLAFIKTYL